MKTQLINLFIAIIAITSILGCVSEEEQLTKDFVERVNKLDIDAVKEICTEDTRFYIRITIEPLLKLGEDKSTEQIASTLKCKGKGDTRTCTYTDENGQEASFEMNIVDGYDENGEQKLLVDIDKSYFLGE